GTTRTAPLWRSATVQPSAVHSPGCCSSVPSTWCTVPSEESQPGEPTAKSAAVGEPVRPSPSRSPAAQRARPASSPVCVPSKIPPETICPIWSALIEPRSPVLAEPSTTYTAPALLIPGLTNGAPSPTSSRWFPDRSPSRPTDQPSPPPACTPRQITPSIVLPT